MAYETDIQTGRCPFRAVPFQHCYWNPELLSSFSFLMAGHGSPVRASMMLGDPNYAREQLRPSPEALGRLADHYATFAEEQTKLGLTGYRQLDGDQCHEMV